MQTLEMPADVLAVTFRPDGRQLCCACLNGTLQLWGTDGGDLQGIIEGRRDIAGKLMLVSFCTFCVRLLLLLLWLFLVAGCGCGGGVAGTRAVRRYLNSSSPASRPTSYKQRNLRGMYPNEETELQIQGDMTSYTKGSPPREGGFAIRAQQPVRPNSQERRLAWLMD